MLIFNLFDQKFCFGIIVLFIWFSEYWFLLQQGTMLLAKHNQVLKCKYVLKHYLVFQQFCNKCTYNFVFSCTLIFFLVIFLQVLMFVFPTVLELLLNLGGSDVPDEQEYLPPNALVPTTTLPSSPPPYSTIYIPEDIDMGLPSYDSLYPGKDNNNPPTSNTRSHPS